MYILGVLIGEDEKESDDHAEIGKGAISIAVQEGLLAVSQDFISFTHDSVNEAAYDLIEPDQRAQYHLKLGLRLYQRVRTDMDVLDAYIFTVAAQIARGITDELVADQDDRCTMALIFLTAGEKSMAASVRTIQDLVYRYVYRYIISLLTEVLQPMQAFPEAHFFFASGIRLLQEEDWGGKGYRLICDICLAAAEASYYSSEYQDLDRYLAVLFKNCRGEVDFLRASCIKVKSLLKRNSPEALKACIEALRVAGENIPTESLLRHTLVSHP